MTTEHSEGQLTASRRGYVWALLASILAFFVFQTAYAQVPTGSIAGTVKDSSGAVVAGATVTVTNRETGLVRNMQSGPDGHYQFSSLPVGVYDLKSEMSGFQSQVQQNLNLTVGQDAIINFSMAVGAVQESVTVEAAAPLVTTTSGSISQVVNETGVTELPLNERNFNSLVLLEPGITVHHPVSQTSSTSIGLAFSTNGAPIRSNFVTVDGANFNSAGGITGVSVSGSMLGVDAIREFRVITNFFPAEYGMTMGSQMVIVSKGGTNRFHGTAFEFLRNSKLDSNNFFVNSANQPIAPFHHNNYGGSLGGPIKKDKTFFFVNYEGVRELKGIPETVKTPNLLARTPGGLVPSLNPGISPYLNLYPLPNSGNLSASNGVGTYTYAFNQPTNEDFGQARVDHNFSDNDQMFVRYTIDDTRKIAPVGFPQFQWIQTSRGQYLTVAENHTFSTTVLNTIRLSYERPFQSFLSPSSTSLSFIAGGQFGMGTLAPGSGITGIGPSLTDPNYFWNNEGTFSDDLSWVTGKHNFKFGTLINRFRDYIDTENYRRGALSYSALTNFLSSTGSPQQMQVMFNGAVADRTYVWNTLGFYAQDDWRLTPRLTLNLGLRYEIQTTTNEATGTGSSVINIHQDPTATLGAPLFANPSLENFSPRFGFAWDVMGDGKTAVRGGFGIFYDLANIVSAADIETTATPPYSGTNILTPNGGGLLFPTPSPLQAAPGNNAYNGVNAPLALRTILYHLAQPHLLSYNLTVEHQLPGNFGLSLGYAGSKGIDLSGTIEGDPTIPMILSNGQEYWVPNSVNTPGNALTPQACLAQPGQIGCRVNPYWGSCECKTNGQDSWYNSFQAVLTKRATRNLQFQVSYTFSKLLDDTQGQHGGEAGGSSVTGIDPGNLKTDKGPADFTVPNYLVMNTLYQIPYANSLTGVSGALLKGWRVGTIFSAQNGLPFTVYLSGNRSRSGVLGGVSNADRPNLIPGCDVITGTVLQYYNPSCFTIQPAGYLGTEGRNDFRGPTTVDWDFSLTKDTPLKALGEGGMIEFRAELFNILNRSNFAIPTTQAFTATPTSPSPTTLITNPTPLNGITAGVAQITRTITDPRQIQFALKIIF